MDIKERIKLAIETQGADMEKLNDLFGMVRLCEDAKERREWLLYVRETARELRIVVTTGTRHMATDMFNTVNAEIFAEFNKATLTVSTTAFNFDAFVDASSIKGA